MPQASDEQRALMQAWFNDSISDGPPTEFLRARGWIEVGGMWEKPTSSHSTSAYEIECLKFLRDEWDYGFQSDQLFFTDVYADAKIADMHPGMSSCTDS